MWDFEQSAGDLYRLTGAYVSEFVFDDPVWLEGKLFEDLLYKRHPELLEHDHEMVISISDEEGILSRPTRIARIDVTVRMPPPNDHPTAPTARTLS